MRRTLGDTWRTEIQWRVALQLMLWGAKIAPAGDAKAHLIDALEDWITDCAKQWNLRYDAKRYLTTDEQKVMQRALHNSTKTIAKGKRI